MSKKLDIAVIETAIQHPNIQQQAYVILHARDWLCQLIDEVKAKDERIAELEMENAHLRIVAQKIGCPYGHRDEKGACRLGYPGCACMDDLLATLAWCPEDESKVAVRLGKRIAQLEEKLAQACDDSARLDWLDSQDMRQGDGWVARKSTTGRGFRVHHTSQLPSYPDIRTAIDNARKAVE